MSLNGQRVKVIGGPWPERIGCEGVIVDRPPTVYPWAGRAKDEVIVLLDEDPIDPQRSLKPKHRVWSCAMSLKSVQFI